MTDPVAVEIRRLPHGEGLALPSYATPGAAGMDVLSAEDVTLPPGGRHADSSAARASRTASRSSPGGDPSRISRSGQYVMPSP